MESVDIMETVLTFEYRGKILCFHKTVLNFFTLLAKVPYMG